MSVKKINNISLLGICMVIALCMDGGFFDSSVAIIGLFIAGSILVLMKRGVNFYGRDKRNVFAIPLVLLGLAAVVSFWAIDYMENLMGVMRLAVICLWMYFVQNRANEERVAVKNMIPLMGCASIGMSMLSFLITDLQPYFLENSRISGFFQYANTNALLFAVGIMILIYQLKEQEKPLYSILQIIVLLAGVFWSGSRSVLLLLMIWGVWYAIRTAEFRKPFLIGSITALLLGAAYAVITGSTANIGRIFTIFTNSSTLWGRLLYYRDAILLLSKKFLGLGRLGYYYSQGTFQSGVYDIKYVHNDFLQLALDYGVIALALVLLFVGWQIIKGKQSQTDKELLVFIGVASLADFHCQYLFIVMLACLFLDYGDCIKEKKKLTKEKSIVISGLFIAFLYIGIATGSNRYGNYDLALSMLPNYTPAEENRLLVSMGTEESCVWATELLEKNPYNITAYTVRGAYYGSVLRIRECINDLDQMLELAPYSIDNYRQYEGLLKNMKEAILAMGEEGEGLELIQSRIDSLPEQLESMEERTSSLAYKINDFPVFSYK